jgi:D-alanyl-D-alanine carboxypeptidase/D-alanyl-D-alanine-endopeptidase (penicillin-binding protein 4)
MRARPVFTSLAIAPLPLAIAIASTLLLCDSGARSEPNPTAQGATAAPAAPAASASGASGAATARAARSPELEAAVRSLVNDRALNGAQIGVVIMDCETGNVLAQSGEHALVNPASNAKLYTAAAALAILHGSHRYQTTLSGTIKSGAAAGLVLRGHGDPSLRAQDLWAMVQELKAHGVKRVEGDIYVDQHFFDEQTTPPAFEQQPNEWASFRAPVSATAVNENTITMTVRPGAAGSNASVSFDPPGFVDIEGTVKTSDSGADTVGLELGKAGEGGRRMSAKVSGAVSADSRLVRYTKRVEDPQLLAGYALRAIIEESGLKVSGDVKLAATGKEGKGGVLARHESEPLSSLLYALGKNSDNFYAEMIFKTIAGEAKTRPAKSEEAAEVVTKWIDKYDLGDRGFVVKNGSGLFDANRTTAHSMAKLLRFAWQDPAVRGEFVAQLSIGGVDGTLHKRFRDARSHRAVRAKTGTLDDAIALSGYVLAPPGKSTIAFSILFNKVSGRASSARTAADKLVELIHDRQWK